MVIFTLAAVATSAYTKIIVSFITGSATVRAWFKKEIAAGKAELAKVETVVKADVAKVGTAIVTEAKKL